MSRLALVMDHAEAELSGRASLPRCPGHLRGPRRAFRYTDVAPRVGLPCSAAFSSPASSLSSSWARRPLAPLRVGNSDSRMAGWLPCWTGRSIAGTPLPRAHGCPGSGRVVRSVPCGRSSNRAIPPRLHPKTWPSVSPLPSRARGAGRVEWHRLCTGMRPLSRSAWGGLAWGRWRRQAAKGLESCTTWRSCAVLPSPHWYGAS